MNVVQAILAAALGGLASILSNQGVAVFNDGLRPIMPEYLEKRMDRKSLAATSFALCFGLVVGFGIPFSIATRSILLVHSILLGTDIIGTWCPSSKKGIFISGGIGALYGLGLVFGLQAIVDLFNVLPVNFLSNLGKVGDPIVIAFAVFPAIAVAYSYGILKGGITFAATILVMQIVSLYGKFTVNTATVTLNSNGMGLLVGMLFLLGFAMAKKPAGKGGAVTSMVTLFSARVKRIQKNIVYLAVMGGLVAAAASAGMLAGDPISLSLRAEGKNIEAALVAFTRGIGFIPLVATTAIATGVYSPVGLTFVFAVGLLIPNPLLAAIAGAVVIVLEVMLLSVIGKGLDRFPGVRDAGDQIRTVMSRVLEVALLIGAMVAANAMAPTVGYLFVMGVYLMNKKVKKPLVDMAVGPVAVIALGVILNILHLIGLFPVAK